MDPTSHPFGVPDDHIAVPTGADSTQGDSDGFEPPSPPVYVAEDKGKSNYPSIPPPSYFTESPPDYNAVVCDDRLPHVLLADLQPHQRPFSQRQPQPHYRSRPRVPSSREIMWNIKAGIGLSICCLFCFFPALLCTIPAIMLYYTAYNKVKNNYSGGQGYCTAAFYLNIIAITSGTVLAIPFIGIILRVIITVIV